MLISEKHKFIFIHIAKVAGQSVTNALMPYAAKPWQRSLNVLCPYRYQLKLYSKLKQYGGISFMPQPFPDHVHSSIVREKMGKEVFRSYYSFAFVRNPWAWVLSNYTYGLSNPRHSRHDLYKSFDSFSEYLMWHCREDRKIKFQRDYVCDDQGNVIIDFVGKQERLANDFSIICKTIGVQTSLPTLNVSRHSNYRESYTNETRLLVRETFKEDIELFDYEF